MANPTTQNPRWWNDRTSSAWEGVKEDLRRDHKPTPATDWDRIEPAMRYGYGASSQYQDHQNWDDKLEMKLKQEWNDLKTGRTWEEIRSAVRRGWDKARGRI